MTDVICVKGEIHFFCSKCIILGSQYPSLHRFLTKERSTGIKNWDYTAQCTKCDTIIQFSLDKNYIMAML